MNGKFIANDCAMAGRRTPMADLHDFENKKSKIENRISPNAPIHY